MFASEIVGSANALAAGWGNTGGGVTHWVMGSMLFPLFSKMLGDDNLAWRIIFIFPAAISAAVGIFIYRVSDDYPTIAANAEGEDESHLKKDINESLTPPGVVASGARFMNHNMWILHLQYLCTVGVEQALYYGLTLYFRDEYDMSTVEAGHIVMAFGWCNTFARFYGGYVSDKVYYRLGMRGRIIWQTVCLLIQGTFILFFAHSKSLSRSVILILMAAIFMMAGAGSTFAIVPFVSPANKGLVSGVVSSGASLGAIVFSIAFRQNTYHEAFLFIGRCIVCSSILSAFIKIEGHEGLFMERDNEFFSNMQRHVASGCYILLLNRKNGKSCDDSEAGTTVNTQESKGVSPAS
eukprot:CAMPEP_0172522764 /NCGR_PEP_ID=MMETSP1066-20121228/293301_1 /TAXON_ID=671091 /ORGANISM="Coscinodiscus wailesii, Strain CCMP2513" /LENGTH=350 /DNA_ID=CAMNT_0013305795 /DNA_START=670 /DNA_END=1722 /DNA_ORIENTATION=-